MSFNHSGTGQTVRLVMESTDEDVIRKFHDIVGTGQVRFLPRRKPHFKDSWSWGVFNKAGVALVLALIYPYLGTRRAAKADELLAHLNRGILGD